MSEHIQKISVFGGASPRPDDPAYMEAFILGKALGSAGFSVLTGGYMGTMEAVSRGAAEANAHVIGVTCRQIESWRNAKPNAWVAEEISCETLPERIATLIHSCDAAIALPGGAGTLAEISLMWNELIIQACPPKPLLLLGSAWKNIFTVYFTDLGPYNRPENRQMLTFVQDAAEAIAFLRANIQ